MEIKPKKRKAFAKNDCSNYLNLTPACSTFSRKIDMNEEDLQEKLEQYVRGKLPSDDREILEAALRDDANLREQLRLHRLAVEADEYLLRQQLRENVRQWVADDPNELPATIKFPFKKWLGILVLAVCFAYY
jgi:hypothetical protein